MATESPLQVRGLEKRFGGLRVLRGVDLEVGRGQLVGLIGPNGCGKTTTFNIISGLLAPEGGAIEVFGQDAIGLPVHKINRLGMSRTFQQTRLLTELTVIENLLVPPKNQKGARLGNLILRRKQVKQQEAELIEKAYRTLEFLEVEHIAHNYCSELSGGQSKLVDLGRALMSDPQILLLDEPVAGVAGPLANKIFAKVRELADSGMSILVIEHNMNFILRKDVDRITVINEGLVIKEGTADEVRQSREVIEAYLGG